MRCLMDLKICGKKIIVLAVSICRGTENECSVTNFKLQHLQLPNMIHSGPASKMYANSSHFHHVADLVICIHLHAFVSANNIPAGNLLNITNVKNYSTFCMQHFTIRASKRVLKTEVERT